MRERERERERERVAIPWKILGDYSEVESAKISGRREEVSA